MDHTEHDVFFVRDEKDHKNIGITFPGGKYLSIGFGKSHYNGPSTAELFVCDVAGNNITEDYVDDISYNPLSIVVQVINKLWKESYEGGPYDEGHK